MFLVSTTQRCGSTWLTRMLAEMTGSLELYVDGLQLGFSLSKPADAGAAERLADFLRSHPAIQVFKTHDVPSASFDAACAALPELRILTVRRDFKDVVVSRYFYMRHHWPTQPDLGPPPAWFAEYLAQIGGAPDRDALPKLLEARVLHTWAREWAAFEGGFAAPRAMRLQYEALLGGTAWQSLETFTGLPSRDSRSFEDEQKDETLQTGREGSARFHRSGRSDQWCEWFTGEQGAQLDALAAAALEKWAALARA